MGPKNEDDCGSLSIQSSLASGMLYARERDCHLYTVPEVSIPDQLKHYRTFLGGTRNSNSIR